MNIKDSNQLIDNKKYWYVSVPNCCRFNRIKIKSSVYEKNATKGMNKNSLDGLVLFDSEEEAEKFLYHLKSIISPNVLENNME